MTTREKAAPAQPLVTPATDFHNHLAQLFRAIFLNMRLIAHGSKNAKDVRPALAELEALADLFHNLPELLRANQGILNASRLDIIRTEVAHYKAAHPNSPPYGHLVDNVIRSYAQATLA